MQELVYKILTQPPERRPYIIAINGIDASGKSSLASALAQELKESRHVQLIHVDDFHLPRRLRAECTLTPPECYYRHTFDWDLLEGTVLEPIFDHGALDLDIKTLDLVTDSYTTHRSYKVTSDSIVIIEGVFLFQPRLLPYFDLKVFLHIDEAECLRRVTQRDGYLFGDSEAIITRYQQKYLLGQALYIQECCPQDLADVVIDNNNYTSPLLTWRT